MTYTEFKRQVLFNAAWLCECMICDSLADQCHHFLKQSTYPEFKTDPDNGMAVCSSCHTEIEYRQRMGEDYIELYPIGRYKNILDKAGIEGINS